MIEFKRLKINNFLCYKSADIDFTDFNSALVVGRRKNDSRISNGTGKSSILKAIDYVLFDEYPGSSISNIVRDGNDKCEVSAELKINDHDYRIERKRSNKSNKSEVRLFIKDNGWKNIDGRTNSDTKKAISDLLGINYTSWKNSILFSQSAIKGLADCTPSQRKTLLKEPLQLAIYNKFEKLAKSETSKIEGSIAITRSFIQSLGNPEEEINFLDSKLKETKQNITETNSQIKFCEDNIEATRQTLSDLDRLKSSDASNISSELKEVSIKISNIEKSLISLKSKIASNETSINDYTDDISNRLKSISLIKDNLDSKKTLISKSEEEIKAEIDRLVALEAKGQKYIAKLEMEYRKYSKPLPDKAECEVCFNELTQEYKDKVIEQNEQKAKELENELKEYSDKLNRCSSAKSTAQKELQAFYKNQNDISNLENKIQNEKSQVQKSQQFLINVKKLLEDMVDDFNNKELELVRLKERKDSLNELSVKLNIEDITRKISENNSALNKLQEEHKNLIESFAYYNANVGVIEEKIRSKNEDIRSLRNYKKEEEELNDKLKLHKALSFAFGAGGIPTLIIHTILDDLQIEANKFLQEIRSELEIQFLIEKDDKDTLDIVFKVHGKPREYELLSGAQKVFVAFALQLGLSLVIQKRLGVDVRLLLLDEVDQPFDMNGQDAFVSIVKELQKKFKVLVVTHNSRLKQSFQKAILVEQDIDGSVAKVVDQW